MHNNRTICKWDHLQNFYNFNTVNSYSGSQSPLINKDLNFNREYSTISNSSNNFIRSNNSNQGLPTPPGGGVGGMK